MVRLTALGDFVGIYPDTPHVWHLIFFDKRGNWKAASWYRTREEAIAARSAAFAHHRKLAKERALRKRK